MMIIPSTLVSRHKPSANSRRSTSCRIEEKTQARRNHVEWRHFKRGRIAADRGDAPPRCFSERSRPDVIERNFTKAQLTPRRNAITCARADLQLGTLGEGL